MSNSRELLPGICVCSKLVPGTFRHLRFMLVLYICAAAGLCELHGWLRLGYRKSSSSPSRPVYILIGCHQDTIVNLDRSCRLPSQRPYMTVRGKPTVDGFFSVPTPYFGAPDIPTADRIVRISVFPTTSVNVLSEQPGGVISPDLLGR